MQNLVDLKMSEIRIHPVVVLSRRRYRCSSNVRHAIQVPTNVVKFLNRGEVLFFQFFVQTFTMGSVSSCARVPIGRGLMDMMPLNPPHFTNTVAEEAAAWAAVSKPLKLQSAPITPLDMSNPEVFWNVRIEMQPMIRNSTFF